MTSSSPSPAGEPDLWHHYGRHGETDVPDRLHWDWYQRRGPGAELLGDVAGQKVADLGAGGARHAAHIARALRPARVVGIDSSPAQHARGCERYGHLARLELVRADAVAYLQDHPGAFDACYSVFGAVDFTDPRKLLPTVATALRPGGLLVFSTLAHYTTGEAPESEVRSARIPIRLPGGSDATLDRWVLDIPVRERLLTETGFSLIGTDTLRDRAPDSPVATNIFRARRSC
ncbi:class I SAM-dependent methyltransferase [Streptomyces niger]|uniref:class I SAM-dependent methyltransferase n=1 Tax=Streptomyces niger TaxID=66373 RepID=UPI001F2624B5|nr:class I SAM-dependent methyltransferase [Streptomyces niger]